MTCDSAMCRLWLCDSAVCRLHLCDDYVYVTIMSVWHVEKNDERRNKGAMGLMWETKRWRKAKPDEIGSTRIFPQPRWFISFYFIYLCFNILCWYWFGNFNYLFMLKCNCFKCSSDYKLISLNCQVLALYFKSNLVSKLDFKLLRKELQGGFHMVDFVS